MAGELPESMSADANHRGTLSRGPSGLREVDRSSHGAWRHDGARDRRPVVADRAKAVNDDPMRAFRHAMFLRFPVQARVVSRSMRPIR